MYYTFAIFTKEVYICWIKKLLKSVGFGMKPRQDTWIISNSMQNPVINLSLNGKTILLIYTAITIN